MSVGGKRDSCHCTLRVCSFCLWQRCQLCVCILIIFGCLFSIRFLWLGSRICMCLFQVRLFRRITNNFRDASNDRWIVIRRCSIILIRYVFICLRNIFTVFFVMTFFRYFNERFTKFASKSGSYPWTNNGGQSRGRTSQFSTCCLNSSFVLMRFMRGVQGFLGAFQVFR